MMTPEPDSSCGRVFPEAGGLVASIDTTAGETFAAIASKRSERWVSAWKIGGGGDWAMAVGVERGPRYTAAAPPAKAHVPSRASTPIRYSMAELSRQGGRTGTCTSLSQGRSSNLTQVGEKELKSERRVVTKGTRLATFADGLDAAKARVLARGVTPGLGAVLN